MKRIPIYLTLCLSLLITSLAGGDHSSATQKAWQPLFNGEDLSDFKIVQGTASYEVNDGIITGRTALGSPNTFLATKKVYGDFELKFEVKVDDALNSGVQIRSKTKGRKPGELGEGRFHGPQVEIEASPGQSGYVWGESLGTGWLSRNPGSEDPAVNQHDIFRNGEWNRYHIIARGPRLQIHINGTLIDDFELPPKIHEEFPRGHIGLQVHSIPKKLHPLHPLQVHWKNLTIRELDAE